MLDAGRMQQSVSKGIRVIETRPYFWIAGVWEVVAETVVSLEQRDYGSAFAEFAPYWNASEFLGEYHDISQAVESLGQCASTG